MLLKLNRNKPSGESLTGTLIVDGQEFCSTLERTSVAVLPLCYHVSVTQSPRFGRLLPILNNVPSRTGIRIHVGTKPEHSSGCILVPNRDIESKLTNILIQAQNKHEEIILEVIPHEEHPGNLYDIDCPINECM